MIDVAVIPARGGSKRLPNKNLRIIGGKPMISWTVEAALSSKCFKRVVVSTDNDLIAKAAKAAGAEVPFMRPNELASDSATAMDVALHAINQLGSPDHFAYLQPTSPFRTSVHIKEALAIFIASEVDALISVSRGGPASWLFQIDIEGKLSKLLHGEIEAHSQHAKTVCSPNGAIYLYKTKAFLNFGTFIPPKTIAYEMSLIDSIDIDDFEDFQLAECIVHRGLRLAQAR
jgi:CMP-N-acetylneuraminic acid synthetase